MGFGIVVLLHGFGLCVLYQVKTNLLNRRLLVVHLALAEFLLSFHSVVIFSVSGHWNADWSSTLVFIDTYIIMKFYTVVRFIVLHIMLDRFTKVYLNLGYPLYMNNKKAKLIVAAEWGS